MRINENTKMLLFRFNNFGNNSFIAAHTDVLQKNGYVWMLKLGKRSSMDKLNDIKENGGWLVLRSPKADGGKSYITQFSKMLEEEPEDMVYPSYYAEILNESDEQSYYNPNIAYQWFKIELIAELTESNVETLVISKTGKSVNAVIETTRTAVMFIQNSKQISI